MISCPLCAKRFDAAISFNFHVRRDHPGALDPLRPLIHRAYVEEKRRRAEAPTDDDRVHPKLLRLYRSGCPCGRTLEQHLARAAEFGRRP